MKISYILNLIIYLCVFSVFASVIFSFLRFDQRNDFLRDKKSIATTGSMIGFFVLYYFLIRFRVLEFNINQSRLTIFIIAIGTLLLTFGAIVNVVGRTRLARNWSNQIKIYKDHKLVTAWPFSLVRHPLYASLVWMFLAGGLIFMNIAALFSTTLIFMPFMFYRARQEEKLLTKEVAGYNKYMENTGMFFPKLKVKEK